MASLNENIAPNLTALFPIQEFTKFEEANFTTIDNLEEEVEIDLRAIPSTNGTGEEGHWALRWVLTAFNALPPLNPTVPRVPWVPKTHPGAPPGAVNGETGPAMARASLTYSNQLSQHVTERTVETVVTRMIKNASPQHCWEMLADPVRGQQDITIQTLMDHLKTTYGKMQREDKARIMEQLREPWDTTQPIEKLLVRARKCQRQLRNDAPMSDDDLMDALLLTITASNVLPTAIHEWDAKDIADQTHVLFAKHFIGANQERLRRTTTAQAGYHAANNVAPPAKAPPANNKRSSNRTPANPTAPKPYCHTHGVPLGKSHFSNTCRAPGPNHNWEATFHNRMGGSDEIQKGRGDRNSNSNSNKKQQRQQWQLPRKQ